MNQYQVSFLEAIKRGFSNYCVFTGRASRSEFWWWQLFVQLVGLVLSYHQFYIIFTHMGDLEAIGSSSAGFLGILGNLFGLAVLLPSLGLLWRRLHDSGHSGWNVCWGFLPFIGMIILLVYTLQPSQPFANQYGEVPNLQY